MAVGKHRGYLCLVLHAHLPYVRHPEHEYFLEENWLYEAITESYIPLIEAFSRLADEGVDYRVTVSVSPTLMEMLEDELLMTRYVRHVERLLDLCEGEVRRTKRDIHFGPVARMYLQRLIRTKHLFEEVYRKDILSVLGRLQRVGRLEVVTSAATHAYLPNLFQHPAAVRAQIREGVGQYRRRFHSAPRGIWLPECGFAPGLDQYLKKERLRFFFLETHGVVCGAPPPRCGVYAPVSCPSGMWVFGRDPETSKQVWSSIGGYPGDSEYREFYRDIGFDIDQEHVKRFLHPYGARSFTGLKYYRITGRTGSKKPYVIERARKKAAEHARDFLMKRQEHIDFLAETLGIRPVITATYDAELFGHWWFEGPQWIENLLREIHRGRSGLTTITPSRYLRARHGRGRDIDICEPSMSSWGERGYSEVWLNRSNDYVYPHVLKAAERMSFLAGRFQEAKGILLRALNQAAREVLLSQHSDWAFMIKNNVSKDYAKKRVKEHIGRFTSLYQMIASGEIQEKWLADLEEKDRIFRHLDYRIFSAETATKAAYRRDIPSGSSRTPRASWK